MRFHLFGGDQYYPQGGMADYLGSFERFDDAMRRLVRGYDWAQIAIENGVGSLFVVWFGFGTCGTVADGWVNDTVRELCLKGEVQHVD